ncbi:MAG TPA: flagellar assembly protein FliW [Lachnospiraceae bacterium]|jgi:flagellar assembly factor FliW|nr:flagellar assembly protein FliW [Lachnospiraceae bacterium]
MKIKTKLFAEIEVDESKIITFVNGIVGFPELKDFLLIHDSEKESSISWLQSIQEPAFAMPVINPLVIVPDYNPEIEDELIKPIGISGPEEMLVLVTITVPAEIEKMSINLRAPIIISGETRKACQVIADGEQYAVKYPIYDILMAAKEKAGE